ncbi:MAG: hypothetical protein AAF642_01185 [Pseudomonadota bacterium]
MLVRDRIFDDFKNDQLHKFEVIDNQMPQKHGIKMPTMAQIARAIEAARRSGMDVAGFKVEPHGAIVVFDKTDPAKEDELDHYV